MKKKSVISINYDEIKGFAFNALATNAFVEDLLLKNPKNKLVWQLYRRLLRAGIIGDILFQKSSEVVTKEDQAEIEFLSALFESYLFLIRTIYDYLLIFFKNNHKEKITDRSFNDFIKKIRQGKYSSIKGKLRKFIEENKIFDEARDLRNSIKQLCPDISVYVKNKKYCVDGIIKINGKEERFDGMLREKIVVYSAGLLLLMAKMYEEITGIPFSEKTKELEARRVMAQKQSN